MVRIEINQGERRDVYIKIKFFQEVALPSKKYCSKAAAARSSCSLPARNLPVGNPTPSRPGASSNQRRNGGTASDTSLRWLYQTSECEKKGSCVTTVYVKPQPSALGVSFYIHCACTLKNSLRGTQGYYWLW